MPPPVHGSSMVGVNIKRSKYINQLFDCSYINILISRKINETGNVTIEKALRLPIIFFKLFMQLFFNRPSLVYLALTATGAAFYRDVLIIIILKLFRIKRLYHLHNKGFNKFGERKIYNLLYRFVFKNTKVILLSKQLFKDVSKYVTLDNVAICPNGIAFQEPNIKLQDSKKKITRILFLSNLIESKGVYMLLEACSLLKKKGVDFECIFVGGEADITVSMFNSKVESMRLQNHVKYLGKKIGHEKTNIFYSSDIFAMPTFEDCFPLVLLEAEENCLPIVTTNEGGIIDIVEDGLTGYIIPKHDYYTLSDKLEILIKNPELRVQMGDAGKKKFLNEFTLDIFEKRLSNIIQTYKF